MAFENNQNINAVNPLVHVEGPAPAGDRRPGKKDKRGRSEKTGRKHPAGDKEHISQQDRAKILSVGDEHIDFRA